MSAAVSLVEALPGREYVIECLEGGIGAARRMEGLGLRLGVRVVKKAGLLSPGPVVVAIGKAEVAIGHGMAAKVIVRETVTGAS